MDRGAWWAAVHGVTESERTELLTLLLSVFRLPRLPWWLRQYRCCLQCRAPGFDPWVWEDPLEKGMATHFNILAWRIPWTAKPDGLKSMGSQRVRHN